MRRPTRPLLLVLAATLLAAAPAGAQVPRLAWTACGDGLECATAPVPLDHDGPSRRTIDLALIRRPATDPARRIGSLFLNPGGPGGSGVEVVRALGPELYTPEVRARFDVVGVDPRGVGQSTPVRCFSSPEAEARFEAPWPTFPTAPAQERADTRRSVELTARCWARQGWLLPHLSTANVARDLDLLRQAVGDARLTYVGYSYGSYLGATYASLFPDRVRALVLDAVVNPAEYTAGPGAPVSFLRIGSHLGMRETLEQFFAGCAAAGPRCAFSAGGDPARKFAALAERLRARPVGVPNPDSPLRVGYPELVLLTGSALYASNWVPLAEGLQELWTRPGGETPPAAPPVRLAPADESQTAILCADTRVPRNPLAWPGIARTAEAQAPYVGRLWAYIGSGQSCASWPTRDPDRHEGPWDRPTSAPALLVATRYDPATPYENAVELERILPASRLLTIEGHGHSSLLVPSACAQAATERYLLAGTLPEPRATCRPDFTPFDPPPAEPPRAVLEAFGAPPLAP